MRAHVATCLVCVVLAIDPIAAPIANAQQSSGSSGTMAPATLSSTNVPLSDYVPCLFSDDHQETMRAHPPLQHPLNRRSAERLLDATNVALAKALTAYSGNQVFLNEFQRYFQDKLNPRDLVGMTPDQANTHIQSVLA